jgi:hypothetical protein
MVQQPLPYGVRTVPRRQRWCYENDNVLWTAQASPHLGQPEQVSVIFLMIDDVS